MTTTPLAYIEAGNGPTVVLLHAFPLSGEMWQPQIEALRSEYRLIAPDLRGFGGSAGFDGTPSIAQMADDVAALLDHLNVREPVVLGGLSMGGYVALAFVRRHAARLRGLILADTRPEPDDATGKANRDKMIAFAESNTALAVINQLMPKMVSPSAAATNAPVVEQVRMLVAKQSPAGIANALRALRDRPDSSDVLPRIAVPTLVIVGADDQITPPAVAEKMANGIKGARMEIISGAGHLSNLEQPAAFTAALRGFLLSL